MRRSIIIGFVLIVGIMLSINMDYFKEVEKEPEASPSHVQPDKDISDSQIKNEMGVYVGRIDNNFIEIKVNEEPKTFLAPIDAVKEEYGEGDEVSFGYYLNDKQQLVITRIEHFSHTEEP